MDFSKLRPATGGGQKLYIETYGCQMNVGDTEIVVSIMQDEGFFHTGDIASADVILINTCSVRDNAEQRVWGRLREFKRYKRLKPGLLVGVIGCMAERLREELMEKEQIVDIVAGPDSYRDLPNLVRSAADGARSVNVQLSREETYAEISPVRLDRNGVSAFIAIMRGCNNFCSYCVVPFTRGRERSRDPQTIVREARELFEAGYREVTLLGQNVNSYSWTETSGISNDDTSGFPPSPSGESRGSHGDPDTVSTKPPGPEPAELRKSIAKEQTSAGGGSGLRTLVSQSPLPGPKLQFATPAAGDDSEPQQIGFPELLQMVAQISPLLRVRFATSHPKDLSDRLLEVMAAMPNICRCIHLPAQSGSTPMLERMNRRYTREWYLDRMRAIKRRMPECSITTDLIAGFCGETQEDHAQTLSLMKEAGYDFAYMFKYSERPDTQAARTMPDDVPDEVKTARLTEIINLQNELSYDSNRRDIGRRFEVLVEGPSKRRADQLSGRTSQNKVVVFDSGGQQAGDYVTVEITGCSSATLMGRIAE